MTSHLRPDPPRQPRSRTILASGSAPRPAHRRPKTAHRVAWAVVSVVAATAACTHNSDTAQTGRAAATGPASVDDDVRNDRQEQPVQAPVVVLGAKGTALAGASNSYAVVVSSDGSCQLWDLARAQTVAFPFADVGWDDPEGRARHGCYSDHVTVVGDMIVTLETHKWPGNVAPVGAAAQVDMVARDITFKELWRHNLTDVDHPSFTKTVAAATTINVITVTGGRADSVAYDTSGVELWRQHGYTDYVTNDRVLTSTSAGKNVQVSVREAATGTELGQFQTDTTVYQVGAGQAIATSGPWVDLTDAKTLLQAFPKDQLSLLDLHPANKYGLSANGLLVAKGTATAQFSLTDDHGGSMYLLAPGDDRAWYVGADKAHYLIDLSTLKQVRKETAAVGGDKTDTEMIFRGDTFTITADYHRASNNLGVVLWRLG